MTNPCGPESPVEAENPTCEDPTASAPLVCRDLVRRFGSVVAVDHVSFEVQEGEIFGLLGPNGAGKTTCLRMLVTLLEPDSGSALVGGFDTVQQAEDVKRVIGFQTGDTKLYERLTPVEFLKYFGRLHRIERECLAERIKALVDDLGITEYKDRLCGALSTGQQQRVSLARALLHKPQVLILDEPTAGLDILSAQYIIRLLQKEAAAGKSVVFSTHILAEAELVCSRIGILHNGKLVRVGTHQELLEATGTTTLIRAFLSLVGDGSEEPDAEVTAT